MNKTQTTETHEGWSNYATWGVNLVLSNDQGTYDAVNERVSLIRDNAADSDNVVNGIWTKNEAIRFDLADFLKSFTDDLCGVGEDLGFCEPSMMAQQVIQAGLAEVDWDEIASAWLSQSQEDEDL